MRHAAGRLSVVAAALFLGGCTTVGPNFARPDAPWLFAWKGESVTQLAAGQAQRPPAVDAAWWRHFDDPALDGLVAEAQRANPNVRTAGLRILEARAQLAIAGSLLFPQQQQLTGQIVRAGSDTVGGGPDTVLTAWSIGLAAGWEIDFWGKFRRGVEAA
ncbi:MAG: TolC family protein, partial [Dechloromonas sp.]|nr:TolC family protein [Dechloromonas sp.]